MYDTRCPHGRTVESRRQNPCRADLPSCEVPPPIVTQLGMIEQYAALAREAIADEHEGNARHYVNQLAGLAASVAAALEDM